MADQGGRQRVSWGRWLLMLAPILLGVGAVGIAVANRQVPRQQPPVEVARVLRVVEARSGAGGSSGAGVWGGGAGEGLAGGGGGGGPGGRDACRGWTRG